MRLIDADSLYREGLHEYIYEYGGDEYQFDETRFSRLIQSEPTVDAVPVIRCRDCKWSTSKKKEGLYHCRFWYRSVKDDDYCGRAERKET